MADLAPILMLPPPTPRLPAREAGELAISPDAQRGDGSGDGARARRFRFRVYDGAESTGANTDLAARGTAGRGTITDRRASTAGNASTQSSRQDIRYPKAETGSSSNFLAQAFAQEQLSAGLHNPPYAAASAAYNRAGAAVYAQAAGTALDIRA
jgi:hypothetical protein